MDRLHRLARRNGGFFTTAEAKACGFNSGDLGRQVDEGGLIRIRRGVYATPGPGGTLSSRDHHLVALRSALARLGPEYAASHDSALVVHGLDGGVDGIDWLDGLDLDFVHVARVGAGPSRRRGGIHTHREALRTEDVVEIGGLRTVRSELAVAQVMTRTKHLETAAILASAWLAAGRSDARSRGREEWFSEEDAKAELFAVLDRFGQRPGLRMARDAVDVADSGCESPAEVLVLVLCWRYDLPRPKTQYYLPLPGDRWAEVDLCWPEIRMVVEFDGKGKYADEEATPGRPGRTREQKLWAEKRREDAIRELRYHVVRLVWADLVPTNQEGTAARLRRELDRAARLARAYGFR